MWSDFELRCLGPRELDVASNETSARERGRGPADDAFLAGYHEHDAALRDRAAALGLVPLAAWTYQLAASRPAYVDLARTRLAWALEGLPPDPPEGVLWSRNRVRESKADREGIS